MRLFFVLFFVFFVFFEDTTRASVKILCKIPNLNFPLLTECAFDLLVAVRLNVQWNVQLEIQMDYHRGFHCFLENVNSAIHNVFQYH